MRLDEASILIVDDEPLLCEIMVNWLKGHAGRAFSAANGAEALRILSEEPIHLIVSDIRMPVMDGITLLKRVKEANPSKPVLMFMTGFSDISPRDAYDMGAEALLEKPIDRKDLLHVIQQSLSDLDSRWGNPLTDSPTAKLTGTFASLEAAGHAGKIAFGRGGFCISSPTALFEGSPVGFALVFRDDHKDLSGEGVVRWTSPMEVQSGVEIMYVDDASRDWLIQFLKQHERVAFVPRSTGIDQASRAA